MKLPGISAIYYCNCEDLQPDLALRVMSGLPIACLAKKQQVMFWGYPSCEASSSEENNGLTEKTKLTFLTTDEIPVYTNIAFLVKTASGDAYLIGSHECHPTVEVKYNSGDTDGDASGKTVEVSALSLKSLLPCYC